MWLFESGITGQKTLPTKNGQRVQQALATQERARWGIATPAEISAMCPFRMTNTVDHILETDEQNKESTVNCDIKVRLLGSNPAEGVCPPWGGGGNTRVT